MSDRTGIAKGSLRPVIYFTHSDGRIILPPESIDEPGIARMCYERRYRGEGWQWCEAGTLTEVDQLQKRLIDQEERRVSKMVEVNDTWRERMFKYSGDQLRQRMISADTSQWERDFIRTYLSMRESKRNKWRENLTAHNWYIWAREQDDSTKVEDKLPLLPGQFERSGV